MCSTCLVIVNNVLDGASTIGRNIIYDLPDDGYLRFRHRTLYLSEDTLMLTLIGGSLWGLLGFRIVFTLASGALLNASWPFIRRYAMAGQEE